jgi:hypothetical protein
MNAKYFLPRTLVALAIVVMSGAAWAQNSGSVNRAFQTARAAVDPKVQTKVVSVYGIGAPTLIEKWYIMFYDPSVASHGRAVLVENNKIVRTYPAYLGKDGLTYSSALTFDPSRISSETPALSAAQRYAVRHHIAYDTVHALLKQTGANKPFRWRVELFDASDSKGFVYVNALDDSVASYTPASSGKSGSSSAANSVEGFGNDVKNTFLGIGGDLQQFFTGERTVDK